MFPGGDHETILGSITRSTLEEVFRRAPGAVKPVDWLLR